MLALESEVTQSNEKKVANLFSGEDQDIEECSSIYGLCE